ncbi:MAG: phosphatidate cytidylyltransferase, partial [Candidatus Celaenobacter antarcticus]|nr:phosphatidate cytidylyltransferase [Candidatus Celaenobacter antarcticus]
GSHLRDSEVSRHTGGTYLLTSSVVVIAVFSKEIAYLAISYLVVGDTFAAFVGLSMGRRKFVRSKKSLEGFIGAFVSCSVWGLLSYFLFLKRVFSYDCAHPELAVILIILGALVASVVESVDLHINDNISIPILSALAMTVIYMFI